MKRSLLVCCLLAIPSRALAQGASDGPTTFSTSDRVEEIQRTSLIEFSVGTFQMFDSTKVFRYDDDTQLIPTSGAKFVLEYFITQYWRGVFMYDLPLSTDKRIVGGEFQERVLASVMSFGMEWAPFQFNVRSNASLEFEGMALGGFEVSGDQRFVPSLVGRMHLSAYSSADNTGFGVYLGVHYMAVVNRIGPLYGVGYRF